MIFELQAKYDQSQARRKEGILPYVKSDTNFNRHSNLHLSPLQRTNTDFDLQNHFTVLPMQDDMLYTSEKNIPTGSQNGFHVRR